MTDQIDNSIITNAPTIVMQEPVAQVRLLPWIISLTVVSILALIAAIGAIIFEGIKYKTLWDQYQLLENESRLEQMYIMELDARLVGKGFIKKDETYISLRPKLSEGK